MVIDGTAIREIINGIWFCLNLALALVFWRYVKERMRKPGWYDDLNIQAALALAFYFSGSMIMRAWVWTLLIFQHRGDDVAFLEGQVAVPLTAAALAVTGALCCIRVFSPGRWGKFFWIGTGIAALAVPVLVHALL